MPQDCSCPTCHTLFTPHRRRKKYCSLLCRQQGMKKPRPSCLLCGAPCKETGAKYCSYACSHRGQYKQEQHICPICHKEFFAFPSRKKESHILYCSIECFRIHQTRPIEDRLWDKVNKCIHAQSDGTCLICCWDWKGTKSKIGYGIMTLPPPTSITRLAHRLVWAFAHHQPIPSGLLVRHLCHRKSCCNPAHLTIGTHKENLHDHLHGYAAWDLVVQTLQQLHKPRQKISQHDTAGQLSLFA